MYCVRNKFYICGNGKIFIEGIELLRINIQLNGRKVTAVFFSLPFVKGGTILRVISEIRHS